MSTLKFGGFPSLTKGINGKGGPRSGHEICYNYFLPFTVVSWFFKTVCDYLLVENNHLVKYHMVRKNERHWSMDEFLDNR